MSLAKCLLLLSLYYILVLKLALLRKEVKYLEFKESLKDFSVFSIREIKKVDPCFHRRRLNEWQDKGYIRKVIKGKYIFSDLEINENILFEISNKIHRPSYVSLEMALSYYHLIPESTYAITAVSSRRPGNYETPLTNFSYRKIKPTLFFGYKLVQNNGKWFKIAGVEKTILDYFYLNPHLVSQSDFESLRINTKAFVEQTDKEKLFTYLQRFSQKKLTKRINSFLDFIENA